MKGHDKSMSSVTEFLLTEYSNRIDQTDRVLLELLAHVGQDGTITAEVIRDILEATKKELRTARDAIA